MFEGHLRKACPKAMPRGMAFLSVWGRGFGGPALRAGEGESCFLRCPHGCALP